jgi:hypothetical protein
MTTVCAKIKEEFLEVLPTTIFFFCGFHIIALTNVLLLREQGVDLANQAAATLGALLVAKVVLVTDKLPWINRFPNKPLMYNVAWKTLLYVACTFVVRFVEHLLPFLFEGERVGSATQHLLREVVWPHFWAIQIWLLVLFFIFSAGRELVRVLGSEQVIALYFRHPVSQDSY